MALQPNKSQSLVPVLNSFAERKMLGEMSDLPWKLNRAISATFALWIQAY